MFRLCFVLYVFRLSAGNGIDENLKKKNLKKKRVWD